jgi:hypothetical protein
MSDQSLKSLRDALKAIVPEEQLKPKEEQLKSKEEQPRVKDDTPKREIPEDKLRDLLHVPNDTK